MRITPFTIFNQLTQSLDRTLKDYSILNNKLSTGKKILAPSDDPNGTMRSLDYKLRINNNGQYKQNIDFVSTSLNFTNTIMTSVNTALSTITSLVTKNASGPQDAMNQATDSALAGSLKDTLLSLANTKYMNQYIFSGFASDVKPYDAGTVLPYDYQGDAGVVNVQIDTGATMQANVTGNNAFSYTLAAPKVVKLAGGENVHYTPGAGTAVTVDIYDTTDTTILDTFSFSNVIQMTDVLSTAISTNNTTRIQALVDPFTQYQTQAITVQTDIGTRLSRLDDQTTLLTQGTDAMKSALSNVEDANTLEVIAQLKQTEVTLQALRDSASRVLSQSLFDFLK